MFSFAVFNLECLFTNDATCVLSEFYIRRMQAAAATAAFQNDLLDLTKECSFYVQK